MLGCDKYGNGMLLESPEVAPCSKSNRIRRGNKMVFLEVTYLPFCMKIPNVLLLKLNSCDFRRIFCWNSGFRRLPFW